MLEQGDGAILTAHGASSVRGLPYMSGPGPAQAAQRNYLQSLHAQVARKGLDVGMLYIGAASEHSAFHTELKKAKAAGDRRGRCLPPIPPISPTCSGACTARRESQKSPIPRKVCFSLALYLQKVGSTNLTTTSRINPSRNHMPKARLLMNPCGAKYNGHPPSPSGKSAGRVSGLGFRN